MGPWPRLSVLAVFLVGLCIPPVAASAGTPPPLVEALLRSARSGNAQAQFLVGALFAKQAEEAQDGAAWAQAAHWWQRAAQGGDDRAQYGLGALYWSGRGVPKDPARAARWWRKAAEQGHADAQYLLGLLYGKGRGVPRDPAEAARWWTRAAGGGQADAQYGLGALYLKGQGVARDPGAAARWFRKAAEQGHADAQFALGALYARGALGSPDAQEAARWLRRAAEQGHPRAQFLLGALYTAGQGIPPDEARAARWLARAAAQGEPGAQYALGALYAEGKGVPRDPVEAYKWLDLAVAGAAARGGEEDKVLDRAIRARDAVRQRLTAAQIARAERRAEAWRPKAERPAAAEDEAPPPPAGVRHGTGFVVGADGRILTAHHLVAGASALTVQLADGRVLEARVAAAFPPLDLAVLRVEGPTPHPLPLAPGESVAVGDPVFTVGYPAVSLLGTEPKFTDGAVSALSGPGGDASRLQISVPLQPGNSGGPLLDERGQVVGIVVARAADLPFAAATGSLPQNVNWAVKAGFAAPLVGEAAPPGPPAASRREAVERARQALCLIQAVR
ncbi:MAG: hypothetical protein Kow0092_05270 [Deferrisomatales bacterium]